MIDREKIIKALERCLICDISVVATPEAQKAYLECEYTVGRYCGRKNVLRDALSLLKEQKAVSAHWGDDTGHWIEGDRNGLDPHTRTTGEMIDTFRCSWCGFYQYWKTPFCPNCGAKMEGW